MSLAQGVGEWGEGWSRPLSFLTHWWSAGPKHHPVASLYLWHPTSFLGVMLQMGPFPSLGQDLTMCNESRLLGSAQH